MIRRLKSEVLMQLPSAQTTCGFRFETKSSERTIYENEKTSKEDMALRRNNASRCVGKYERRTETNDHGGISNGSKCKGVVKKYVKDLMDTVRSSEYSRTTRSSSCAISYVGTHIVAPTSRIISKHTNRFF